MGASALTSAPKGEPLLLPPTAASKATPCHHLGSTQVSFLRDPPGSPPCDGSQGGAPHIISIAGEQRCRFPGPPQS